jgi:hypothetical protein
MLNLNRSTPDQNVASALLNVDGINFDENTLKGTADVQSLASNITQNAKLKANEAVANLLAKQASQQEACAGRPDDPEMEADVTREEQQQSMPMITIGGLTNDVGATQNFSFPIQSLGIPMVDERNKRGRPPKKKKPPEVEQREKELLNQKIMMQVKQGLVK